MDIGINHQPTPVRARRNPPMDEASNIKMAETIIKWHNRDYLLGPFKPNDPFVSDARVNPVFSVPKPDNSVRPVVNYSKAMNGYSLNDYLYPEWCSVEYIKIQEIVYVIWLIGVGAKIWAKDLEDGYFNIRPKESQLKLMAFAFAGFIWVPMVLVFGLSTAPLIFTIFMGYVVSAIRFHDTSLSFIGVEESVFKRQYFQQDTEFIYKNGLVFIPLISSYLDDIFGVHHPNKVQDQYDMAGFILIFLGLSAKAKKDRPPSTVQIILGLEYDTIKQEVRTPKEKALRYIKFGRDILAKKKVPKKCLFSLTGKIRHASGQCKPLASFARGVEIHGHKIHGWNHHIYINRRLRSDIDLMLRALDFVKDKGVPFEHILKPGTGFDFDIYTDATSKYGGIGAFVEIPNAPWIQVHWDQVSDTSNLDIQWKEMAAIAVTFSVFRHILRNKHVCVWTDNEPVAWMLIKWRAKLDRPDLQGLIRFIAEICIFNNITPWWEHIQGENNNTADFLSRFKSDPWKVARVSHAPNKTPAKKSLQFVIDRFSQ